MFYTFYTFPCFSTNLQDIHTLYPHSQLQVSTIRGSKAVILAHCQNVKDIYHVMTEDKLDLINRQIYISNHISFQPEEPKMRLKSQSQGREKLKIQE